MDNDKPIYSHNTLDFVMIAVKFCGYLEQASEHTKREFLDTMLKMLPQLYVSMQLLPEVESDGDFLPSAQVTEGDYEFIRGSVFGLLGDDDEYLEVCEGDDMQTDETQWRSVSEHLADVYQPVRNFLAVYQDGREECMHDALYALIDSFHEYWGRDAVDALRQLHHLRYSVKGTEEEEYE